MSEHIPAWKKIGLKVKQELEEDPLALTTHLENANLSVKDIKKINKQKRKLQESNNLDSKKEPKRVKKPKSERAPPPEKDQLTYLKQYENDREHWKFSKQKQNWILKNVREIPKHYESALKAYLDGLQGGCRTRIVDDLKAVVKRWNELAEIAEARIEKELERKLDNSEDKEETKEKKEKQEKREKKELVVVEPDYDYAKRCGILIKLLTDEIVELRGIDMTEEEEEKEEQKEAQQEEQQEEQEQPEQLQEPPVDESTITDVPKENLIIEEVDVDQFSPLEPSKSKTKSKKKKSKKSKT